MIDFFDTSVFVAASWEEHPQHESSFELLHSASPQSACCAAHTLAETYSVLTRMPIRPVIAPEQAMLFLNDVASRVSVIALSGDEYLDAILKASVREVKGGKIYDWLILAAAMKCEATSIYTWNVTDFKRLAPDLAERIQTP